MNKDIMRKAGFEEQIKAVELGNCPLCFKVVNEDEFKDETSKREFNNSGLCQCCQDKIFSGPDE